MYFDYRAVEADRLDLDPYELLMLQFLEQSIQHPRLGPAIHTGVDGVPIAEALWHAAPLAAILRDIQDRVDHLKVTERDISALYRQKCLNPTELLCGDFHVPKNITHIN
jgi:hypothetical protein